MDTFPAFYPLKGRRVVIAGDGEPAEAKTRLFLGSPAEVTRLDREAAIDPAAYAGADLIFVASFDTTFARAAADAARSSGAPLNVVDHPELSDFHTPAIIDRGRVVAAIGSAGAAPLLASLLRAEIETRVRPAAGDIAALLGDRREALRDAFPDLPLRRAFLRAVLAGDIADAVEAGELARAADQLDQAIAAGFSAVGRVVLLEVPSEPDLISIRAVRVLNSAEICAFGQGAVPLVDAHARRDAERWSLDDVAFEVLVENARLGRLVAVLGHPDPSPLVARLTGAGVEAETLAPAPAR